MKLTPRRSLNAVVRSAQNFLVSAKVIKPALQELHLDLTVQSGTF